MNDVAVHLRGTNLTISNQIWHAFICTRLMLVIRLNEVTKDRVKLLYCLSTGRSINIGKVIRFSIPRRRLCAIAGGFGHPCLITELCLESSVVISRHEERVSSKGSIYRTTISDFRGHGDEECSDKERR